MPISSEEYHTRLNALLIEVATKLMRGESSTVGGMDWEDAERFLKLAAEHVSRELSVSCYPDGRLKVVEYLAGEDGSLLAPNVAVDIATQMKRNLADERDEREGGDPEGLLVSYAKGLDQVKAEIGS